MKSNKFDELMTFICELKVDAITDLQTAEETGNKELIKAYQYKYAVIDLIKTYGELINFCEKVGV